MSNEAVHVFERTQGHKGPFRVVGFEERTYQACPEAPVQSAGVCDHCGTCIRNCYIISAADGHRFVVGCDCVAKTGDAGLISEIKRVQAERRAAAKEARREAQRTGRVASARAQAEAVLAADRDLHEAFETWATAPAEPFEHTIADIRAKLYRYGSISPAQRDLVVRLHFEHLDGGLPGCALPPAVAAPVSDKRLEFDATIVGTRVDEGPYGNTLKALYAVRTPEGQWKAWGTVPSGAYELARSDEDGYKQWKGLRLRIRAAVEVSSKDPAFAFLRRPSVVK